MKEQELKILLQRFFPLPDYELSDQKTKMTLTGKIIDPEFAEILSKNPELSLSDILMLDRVQKEKEISEEELKYLRKLKLIEGCKYNIYLSFKVVQPTQDEKLKQQYITNRSFDDNHFKEMILKYLKLGKAKAKRKSINELVIPKLSAALTEDQKRNKVTNYLTALRMEGKIKSLPGYYWQIV